MNFGFQHKSKFADSKKIKPNKLGRILFEQPTAIQNKEISKNWIIILYFDVVKWFADPKRNEHLWLN